MGLATFATLAIGEKNTLEEVANPHFLKNHLSKLRYLSKNLSRKESKS
jgi:transposase